MYTFGSFSFNTEDPQDCSEMIVRVTVSNQSSQEKSYDLRMGLPEGFSSQPWNITRDLNCSLTVSANGSNYVDVPVYPLYADECPSEVEFQVYGDLRQKKSVEVKKNQEAGTLYACPSVKVNADQDKPIIEYYILEPIDDLVNSDPEKYNKPLAVLGSILSKSIYKKEYLYDSLKNLGFTQVHWEDGFSEYKPSSCFSVKKVIKDDKVYPIVLVVVQGKTGLKWIGNYDKGLGERLYSHFDLGSFGLNTDYIGYCGDKQIPEQDSRTIFYGHGYAAAIVNVICDTLNKEGANKTKDRTAYCFGTPNSTKNRDENANKNIHNVIYANDWVVFIPQGYKKHGRIYVAGNEEGKAPPEVSEAFFRFHRLKRYWVGDNTYWIGLSILNSEINDAVLPLAQTIIMSRLSGAKDTSGIALSHGGECYMAWTGYGELNEELYLYESLCLAYAERVDRIFELVREIISQKLGPIVGKSKAMQKLAKPIKNAEEGEGGSSLLDILMGIQMENVKENLGIEIVACPVDLELLDASGNLIGSVKNHQLDEEILDEATPNDVLVFPFEEHNLLSMSAEQNYTLKMTATDNGTMTIEHAVLGEDNECIGSVAFYDIPVKKGEVYTLEMKADLAPEKWVITSNDGKVYYPNAYGIANYLPAFLKTLEAEAFADNTALSGTMICPEGMTSIGARAFAGTNLTAVSLPASVTEIDDKAFEGCNALIYCPEDSTAYDFAVEHGIKVVPVD